MNHVEETIKKETDKFVNQYKDMLKQNGVVVNITDITDPALEVYLRAGVAQGIAIASAALLQISIDEVIFHNKDKDNEVKEDDNLLTFEDYKKSYEINVDVIDDLIKSWSEPKCKCPCCGVGKMRKDMSVVLTTYPPQYKYVCDTCTHVENLDF